MTKPFTTEECVVVALAQGAARPVVVIGMTEPAFAAIEDGRTHVVDMNMLGIPASLVIMRGKDRMHVAAQLGVANEALAQGSNPPIVGEDAPDWAAIVNDLLDTGGERGTFHALKHHEAAERAEAALKWSKGQ